MSGDFFIEHLMCFYVLFRFLAAVFIDHLFEFIDLFAVFFALVVINYLQAFADTAQCVLHAG